MRRSAQFSCFNKPEFIGSMQNCDALHGRSGASRRRAMADALRGHAPVRPLRWFALSRC